MAKNMLQHVSMKGDTTAEIPLSKGSWLALAVLAGTTILSFYIFAALSLLFLSGLLACEFILLIALARFGAAALIGRTFGQHLALVPLILRSFRLGKASEFRIALKRDDAPRLFDQLTNLCEQAEVAMPHEVLLEMSVNAWVRLAGYRRGAGKTSLGLGYDLLAGLSELEMRAVLAHEMAHARLVQRGLNKWLQRGLNRAARLAGGLAEGVDAGRRTKQNMGVAKALVHPADWLTRNCAKLVAACSRQDEFEADRGAAELCGAGALGSALLKLDGIGQAAARLPWRERVAQLQLGQGFSHWLMAELTASNPACVDERKSRNKYGTHPSLADRLAALHYDNNHSPSFSPPALKMLVEPDRLAEQLIAEIQRAVAQEELKDSKALERWSRKIRSQSRLHPLQSLGLLVALVGLVCGMAYWATVEMSVGLVLFMAATVLPGALCYRCFKVKERLALPVPDFSLLKAAFRHKQTCDEAKIKELESALSEEMRGAAKKKGKASLMVVAAFGALGTCDYVRAHVASRLCLKMDKKSVEGMLGLCVAAGALGQTQQVETVIRALRKRTQITQGSAAWGIGWALLLLGNWSQAEAFLQAARKSRPAEPTLLALQALCQAKRGKLQSAIVTARQACKSNPANQEYAKLLISLLLDSGFVREAQELLDTMDPASTSDTELMPSLVRLNLMIRNIPAAQQWSDRLKSFSAKAQTLLQLGGIYESCRQHDRAAQLYEEALVTGHYPEARLGLGRLEAAKKNKENARVHFLAALDFERPTGEESCGAYQVFHPALQQLLMLQEPANDCVGWIATLDGSSLPWLAKKSLMIYSSSRTDAEESLKELLQAMQPSRSVSAPASIAWRQARQEQQPFGLVRPGVQGICG